MGGAMTAAPRPVLGASRRRRQHWRTGDANKPPRAPRGQWERMRCLPWRRLLALPTMAAAISLLRATAVQALPVATSATHTDGVTYCWQAETSVYTSDVADSTKVVEASGNACPVMMSISFEKDKFYADEAIKLSWTASLRWDTNRQFSPNKFNVHELYAANDGVSDRQYNILRSELRFCEYPNNCDPVAGKTTPVGNVPVKVDNFSDGQVAFATDRLLFTEPKTIILLARISLPGKDAEKQRYDYAIYKNLVVEPRPSVAPVKGEASQSQSRKSSKEDGGGGMSTEVVCIIIICGIVAIAMVVIGFTTFRKEQDPIIRKGPEGLTRQPSPAVDDDFAMLSCNERMMRSIGPHRNTFLTAERSREPSMVTRESRSRKSQVPLPYVGPAFDRKSARYHQRGTGIRDARDVSDIPVVDPVHPTSMRHDVVYASMQHPLPEPPYPLHPDELGPPAIQFNDITEEDLVEIPPLPTPLSSRRSSRRQVPAVDDNSEWRRSACLSFDDLHRSNDQPLTLSDLESGEHRPNEKHTRGLTRVCKEGIL